MKQCTTHHRACDCREAHFVNLRNTANDMLMALYKLGLNTDTLEKPYKALCEVVDKKGESCHGSPNAN